MKLVTQSVSKA